MSAGVSPNLPMVETMTTNPQMTVRQLADALAKEVAAGNGALPVSIWLPGSLIDLHQMMGSRIKAGEVLIEGNLREGSALCT